MHRSESEDESLCISCGTTVSPEDRVYAIKDDVVLCFDCAVARSGAYDEQKDRWTESPSLEGLDIPED